MNKSTLICNINNEPHLVVITGSSEKDYIIRRGKKKPRVTNNIHIKLVNLRRHNYENQKVNQ